MSTTSVLYPIAALFVVAIFPLFTRVSGETVWKIRMGSKSGLRVPAKKGRRSLDRPLLAARDTRSRSLQLFSKQFRKCNSTNFALVNVTSERAEYKCAYRLDPQAQASQVSDCSEAGEENRVVRVAATFAVGVATGAILLGVAVLLLGPWWVPATRELVPPVPRLSSDGPVVRNGVAVVVVCGKKRVSGQMDAASSSEWTRRRNTRPSPGRARGGMRRGARARSFSPPTGRDPARGAPAACAVI